MRHLLGHGARNARFALGVQRFALLVRQILHSGAGNAHAPMKAHQQPGFSQALHIAAHGLQGHAQGVGKVLDGGRLASAYFLEQQQLAGILVHTVVWGG